MLREIRKKYLFQASLLGTKSYWILKQRKNKPKPVSGIKLIDYKFNKSQKRKVAF